MASRLSELLQKEKHEEMNNQKIGTLLAQETARASSQSQLVQQTEANVTRSAQKCLSWYYHVTLLG